MQLHLTTLPLLILTVAITTLAIPLADPSPDVSPVANPLLDRDNHFNEFEQRNYQPQHGNNGPPNPPSPPAPPGACPSQKPIAQNLCTSGSPYCCSGEGSGQVCGPASSTSCSATTICCINTNGMQICAGEIDFTGPVTININL